MESLIIEEDNLSVFHVFTVILERFVGHIEINYHESASVIAMIK